MSIPHFAGYLFDLDGTLYLGEVLLPGVAEALGRLRARGAKLCYMTNKPFYSPEEYASKLNALGLPAHPSEVLTSALALGTHLAAHDGGRRVLLLGEEEVRRQIIAAGCEIVTDWKAAEIVVLSWDRGFTYDKLDAAMQALRAGARFYATNPDVSCPLAGGRFAPDCGALIAALQACSGRAPDLIAGKPGSGMPQAALTRLALTAEQCVLVGDRLQTDIQCGRRAGIATVLVLTGVTDEAALAACPPEWRPDYVLKSVAELP